MNCVSPKIIINPTLFRVGSMYDHCVILGRTFPCHLCYCGSKNRLGKEHYPVFFMAHRHGVTLDNYQECYAFNEHGDTIPFYITVPCGKCANCISAKQFDFSNRLEFEQYGAQLSGSPLSYFFTLTYDNEHLPSLGVCKRDVQLFLKRFRITLKRKYNIDSPLRYCVFSEYGGMHGRPHYHGIIFGLSMPNFTYPYFVIRKLMRDTWHNGFVHLKLCHTRSFSYLSKYMLKGSNVPTGKLPNFRLASNRNGGIGCSALVDDNIIKQILNPTDLKVSVHIFDKVKELTIPSNLVRYYLRECDSVYRCKYLEHVHTLCYRLHQLNDLFSYDKGRLDFFIARVLRRNFNIDTSYIYTADVPDFVVKKFPFCADVFQPMIFERLDNSTLWDATVEFIKEYKFLLNCRIDFGKLAENSVYLSNYLRYVKQFTHTDTSDSIKAFRNSRNQFLIDSFTRRSYSSDNQ